MTKSIRFQCPECKFVCGRNKSFANHLIEEHSFCSIMDAFVKTKLNGVTPRCGCTECDSIPKFYGWNKGFAKFVDGHNSKIYSYLAPDVAREIGKKRAEKLTGRKCWSKGLTKETSLALRQAAETRSITVGYQFASGERVQWNKGVTKETNKSVSKAAQNLSDGYKSGEHVPWSKGLTKETSKKILRMSRAVSITLRDKETKIRLNALERLTYPEITRRLDVNSPNLELLTDLSNHTYDWHKNLKFKCRKCSHIQVKSFFAALSNNCDDCNPSSSSKQQLEIDRFIASLGMKTDLCDRTVIAPYEIDILVPERSLGIEFNDLYFHSEDFKNRNYHADKTRMCAEMGVQLMHIFEDEWRNNKEICKSMITHKLGLTREIVFARKCQIRVVSPKEKKEFFDYNHIDGDTNSKIAFGLFSARNKLVVCISLKQPSHKKYSGMLEITRFCTKSFVHVPGGLGKLTEYALNYCHKNGFNSLLTYVDIRHGTKNGYLSAGYEFLGSTDNKFWWTGGRERIDRFKIRTDKENNLTEKEVALEHGVIKIWGCPKLIFKYDKKKGTI